MASKSQEKIKISKNDLLLAADKGIISSDQMKILWNALCNVSSKPSKMLPFLYYLGAMLIISAMTWFMNVRWDWLGGMGLFLIAFSYGMAFFVSGFFLWRKTPFKIPGGLLTTAAICMTPLAVFGLEKYFSLWPSGDPGEYMNYYIWVKSSWIFMEIATVLVGIMLLKFVRFPFMTAPIAASFWFISMDVTPLLFGELEFTLSQKCWVSIAFGLALLVSCYFIDRRFGKDFAFWGYIFGALSFSGGLALLAWSSELNWWFYCLINMAMMGGAIVLGKNILMIFGAFGLFNFLSHLAYETFKDSIAFPFLLSFIGVAIIISGIFYQKIRKSLS